MSYSVIRTIVRLVELIATKNEAIACTWCDSPIEVGDRCYIDDDTIYCSKACFGYQFVAIYKNGNN